MRKIVLLFLFMGLVGFANAQKQGNIWYFGNHAGLDFNTGTPIILTNGATYNNGSCPAEGTAVICDSTGALLLYTNGQKIWNKNHQIMPNGDSLLGNYSSTQAAIIIPRPGTSRYFYVFTTDDFCDDNLQYGFRYSIVDICLDNGLGKVLSGHKNIKLLDTVAEKLTAVRHANGADYWIIVHKYYSDAFYSYHLSSSGIIDTVISHVGSRHPLINAYQGSGEAIGYLTASPDGNKLAIVNGNAGAYAIAEYFDFDKNTGIISNWKNLQTSLNYQNQYQYYGVSFSPDNSKLYIASWLNQHGIYQYDLNAGGGNIDSVKASKINVANSNMGFFGLQLANNEKIYTTSFNTSHFLGVINNPNSLGQNTNFQDSAIYLNGNTCGFALPNFINSYDYSNATYNCSDTTEDINEFSNILNISIYPNPVNKNLTIETPPQSTIQIHSIHGQLIKTLAASDNETNIDHVGWSSYVVDVSALPAGMYIVQVKTEKGVAVGKFVKE